MKYGTQDITAKKFGDQDITKVYYGTELVWEGGTTPPVPVNLVKNSTFDADVNFWHMSSGDNFYWDTDNTLYVDDASGYPGTNGELTRNLEIGEELQLQFDVTAAQGTTDEFTVVFVDTANINDMYSAELVQLSITPPYSHDSMVTVPPLINGASKWDAIDIWGGWDSSGLTSFNLDNVYLWSEEGGTEPPPDEEEDGSGYAQVDATSKAEIEDAVAAATVDTRINVTSASITADMVLTGNTANVIIHPKSAPHATTFEGTVKMECDNVTFRQCRFGNNTAGTVKILGDSNTIIRCIFDNYGNNENWIYLGDHWESYNDGEATNATIAYNTFQNKDDGTSNIIVAHLDQHTQSTIYGHHIHHNYFKDIYCSEVDNGEVIILWGYESPQADPTAVDSDIVIEYNLFESAQGNGKIMDLKTNGIEVKYNTVTGDGGAIIYRHAKRGYAYRNVWTDLTDMRDGDAGILRINDIEHVLEENYIDGYAINSDDVGLRMYNGDDSSDGYVQCVDNQFLNNVITRCSGGIEWGRTSGDAITDTIMIGNEFIECNDFGASFYSGTDPEGTTWTDNKYKGSYEGNYGDLTEDTGLVATVPSWRLTPSDVGPDA